MRHVEFDPAKLTLPANWAQRVLALKKKIDLETDVEKRGKLIDANSDLWKEVKLELAKLFNFKCWYTESPQQGTDVDVDHYRPKKRVQETYKSENPHTGYWWLAFELKNYRYSCIVANRRRKDVESGQTGGKSDHFPLVNEENRAYTPTCDLEDEQPVLLDPIKFADVALITFKEDGEAMPSRPDRMQRQHHRAMESIKYYSLNHSDFVRCRLELRDEIEELTHNAKRFFNKLETGDADNDLAYEQAIKKLHKMRDIGAPFSSFCVAYLDKFRHNPDYEGVLDGIFL